MLLPQTTADPLTVGGGYSSFVVDITDALIPSPEKAAASEANGTAADSPDTRSTGYGKKIPANALQIINAELNKIRK